MGRVTKKKQVNRIAHNSKRLQTSIIIVCEGETEKYYFNKRFNFGKAVIGKGQRKMLVEYAIRSFKDSYETIWCVFDRDYDASSDNTQFDAAIKLANKEKIKTAYSNDAFELWACLHYRDYNNETPIHRTDYIKELARRFGNYEKGDEKLFEKLSNNPAANETQAIERAKKLHRHFELQEHLPYHKYNPCTTVYLLIEELEKKL